MRRRVDPRQLQRLFKGTVALLLAVAFSSCASFGPSYRPKGANDSIGYTDEQIAPNRFRVSFAGPAGSKLVEVEDLLLRRAAEITIKAGYTHFVFDTRRIETNVRGRRAGETWRPELGLLFDCGRDGPKTEYNIDMIAPGYCPSTPILQYVASSEIVVMKAEEASRNPLALAAREVLARLAPSELADDPSAGT